MHLILNWPTFWFKNMQGYQRRLRKWVVQNRNIPTLEKGDEVWQDRGKEDMR